MKRPSALLPDAEAAPRPPPRPAAGGPLVERIAGWSARHRKTALVGWLTAHGLTAFAYYRLALAALLAAVFYL